MNAEMFESSELLKHVTDLEVRRGLLATHLAKRGIEYDEMSIKRGGMVKLEEKRKNAMEKWDAWTQEGE